MVTLAAALSRRGIPVNAAGVKRASTITMLGTEASARAASAAFLDANDEMKGYLAGMVAERRAA
jgi:hypothetical protein